MWSVPVLVIALSGAFLPLPPSSSAEEECREVIHLDFGAVRGDPPSTTPPYPASTGGAPCASEVHRVFCSDAAYPNDVYCDIGRIKSHPNWGSDTGVGEVRLTYAHPTAQGTYCTTHLQSQGGGNLTFVGAECTPVVEDETLPRFRVSDIVVLKIYATVRRAPEESCEGKIYNFGSPMRHGGVKGGVNRQQGLVKFDMNYFVCVSGTTTFIGGRGPQKTTFLNDGRRYRPLGTTTSIPTLH